MDILLKSGKLIGIGYFLRRFLQENPVEAISLANKGLSEEN